MKLHGSKRQKVALIEEEQFRQVLVQDTTEQAATRSRLQHYNATASLSGRDTGSERVESESEGESGVEGDDTPAEKRQKCLDNLQKVLIEFDALSRTTDMLKSKQHLSLQTCDRPATSFRNPRQLPSVRLASRKADLGRCSDIFAKGIQQCKSVSSHRKLFALDCLSLRRHWKLVLSPSSGSAIGGFAGSSSKESFTRIGKDDFLAIDCSYATAGDIYDERCFTKMNKHLPFIVQLAIGEKGAALRHTDALLLNDSPSKGHESEEGTSDEQANTTSELSTLTYSLMHRNDAGQWRQIAYATSFETLQVHRNQLPLFAESRTHRGVGGNTTISSDTGPKTNVKPNLLDMMEMDSSDDEQEQDNNQPSSSNIDDDLDMIHVHCKRVQHDHFCRRMFEVLLAEGLASQREGNFVVTDQRPSSTADMDGSYPPSHSLPVSQIEESVFISHLEIAAASRSSIGVALSSSLSLTISLDKQSVVIDKSQNNYFEKCLGMCVLSMEHMLLLRFESSRKVVTESPFFAADSFRNRFPSLRRNNEDSTSRTSLLKLVQQELQKRLWRLRVQDVVESLSGVSCSWKKRTMSHENVEMAVLVKVPQRVGVGSMVSNGHDDVGRKSEMVSQNSGSHTLVLRLHPTFVEVGPVAQPVQRYNASSTLKRYLDSWNRST